MPYAPLEHPSIGVSLLKAAVHGSEIQAEVVYGNMHFADRIGFDPYRLVEEKPTERLVGEWTFSAGLFPSFESDVEAYLNLVVGAGRDKSIEREAILAVREAAPTFVDDLAARVVARRSKIVGCSSTFEQHCASLALLRRIRELSPDTITLMGGANCEGEMGVATLEHFPWVDFVVSGEADSLFPDLCRLLIRRGRRVETSRLPHGVIGRGHLEPSQRKPGAPFPPRGTVTALDKLPMPDYDDYFEALRTVATGARIRPGLLAETSRGCWWGEKAHCTFCGLNGFGMGYRSKAPERVVAELLELARRYGIRDVELVDNILDMSHIQTVLPKLAASGEPLNIFYETKANLKRQQLKQLAAAGVRWIQPGIESLHDSILKLIAKGNSAMINLQLLKWAREHGIRLFWNFLCGFPGEAGEWYREMADWLPRIYHLQPPSGVAQVRYDRFSPYQIRPEEYGIDLVPFQTYSYVYPFADESLRRLAYFFEDGGHRHALSLSKAQDPAHALLRQRAQRWRQLWIWPVKPVLTVSEEGDKLRLQDTRPGAPERRVTLEGLAAEIYLLCDSAQSLDSLVRMLNARSTAAVSSQAVLSILKDLDRRLLLLRLNDRYLSLAVAIEDELPALPRIKDFPGGFVGQPDYRQLTIVDAENGAEAPSVAQGAVRATQGLNL
jgi:magnesium-protoporphyrin IX monomethyl ester (oxidative) cyclase